MIRYVTAALVLPFLLVGCGDGGIHNEDEPDPNEGVIRVYRVQVDGNVVPCITYSVNFDGTSISCNWP